MQQLALEKRLNKVLQKEVKQDLSISSHNVDVWKNVRNLDQQMSVDMLYLEEERLKKVQEMIPRMRCKDHAQDEFPL